MRLHIFFVHRYCGGPWILRHYMYIHAHVVTMQERKTIMMVASYSLHVYDELWFYLYVNFVLNVAHVRYSVVGSSISKLGKLMQTLRIYHSGKFTPKKTTHYMVRGLLIFPPMQNCTMPHLLPSLVIFYNTISTYIIIFGATVFGQLPNYHLPNFQCNWPKFSPLK